MKISINSIRNLNHRYGCSGDPAPNGINSLIEKIGAQLGGIEEVIHVGKKYEGVVIARVVSCEQHPNADRLHVCMIDDGGIVENVPRNTEGLVQVVCGAPNVKAGVIVAWLPPGATVPSTADTDPFVLEARELRGVVSNGMLASPKELALGDSHEGLLLIDKEVVPGTLFADKYSLRDDVVLDIENKMFTHRPDCFGWMGVAREIAGIQDQKFTSPDWYRSDAVVPGAAENNLRVEVRNEIPELVSRFLALPMSDITVRPSPVWLQVELARVGVRPINNIVDLTNYYMLLTGQPLHAYDYDKVVAQDEGANHATLVVRKPHENEKLRLLNGKEITPREDAILIASATKAIGLGGVMGGGDTEVDENTKNIILECASFDMYSIRRTSMAHGLFSDAVTRFTKGQSPLQNKAVLAKIADDVIRLCEGKVAGELVDDNHVPGEILERNAIHSSVQVAASFINQRLGLKLAASEMAQLLRNVEFVVDTQDNSLKVTAPFWRTDIEIPEDIVEEVGRLYGFDKLPLELPRRTITPVSKDPVLEAKNLARNILSQAGANEVLTYSFVHENLLAKAGQDKKAAFKLSNALSPDLQYYRLSLSPSLLDKVHMNIKAGYDEFAIFEIGKVHGISEIDDDGLPKEFGRLSLVFAANEKRAETAYTGAAYYEARKYLEQVYGDTLTFKPLDISADNFKGNHLFQQMVAPFEPSRSALVYEGERLYGVIGEYKRTVYKNFKLPAFTAGFEVFLSSLHADARTDYVSLPRFPSVTQDISLKVPASVAYQGLQELVKNTLANSEQPNITNSLMPLDIYQREDDSDHKQVTFRLRVASYEKTMTDAEVNAMLDSVAQAAKDVFGAERI